MAGAKQEEKMETDAEPFDIPRSGGKGSTGRRGRAKNKPSSYHSSTMTQGMDGAFKFLPPGDRAEIQQALQDAEEAVRSVRHLPGSGLKMKSVPNPSLPGGVNVQTFNNCENVHIGETHVITNHNYGHGGSDWRPEAAGPPKIDEQIRRLLGNSTPLTTADATCLADNVGSVWRRLGRALGLSDGQLDDFKHDFHLEGQHEIIYQMIRGWMKKAGVNATVGAMVKAFVTIRRLDIARIVFVKKR